MGSWVTILPNPYAAINPPLQPIGIAFTKLVIGSPLAPEPNQHGGAWPLFGHLGGRIIGRQGQRRALQGFLERQGCARGGVAAVGSPHIFGELKKIGITLPGSTVAKYMGPHRKPPSHTWRSVLRNHVRDIVTLAGISGIRSWTSSSCLLELPDERREGLEDARSFLARFPGKVILAEFQRVPDLLSYIQIEVDREDRPGPRSHPRRFAATQTTSADPRRRTPPREPLRYQ
jgi:hypothetical protein